MKKGRELLVGSYRTLNQTPITPAQFHQTMSDSDSSNRYSYNPTLHWNPQVHQYFLKAYGADHFFRISTALTRPSRYSCIRVNTLRSTGDVVIEKLRSLVPNADVAPAQSGSEDDVANPLKECLDADAAPFSKCQIPGLDYVVFVWGSGPHRIDYGNVPPKEVIVSRKCAEAVLRGAQVYVPGVMACSAHVEKGDTVAVSVAVEQQGADGGWGIGMTRGTVLQGSETDPYYFERNGLYIGQGTAMLSRAGMFRVSEGVGVDMKDRVYELHSFHNVLEGEIFLQNLPSIIAAHALDPQMGERILDMCAAPGGKTTAIAILMKDEGEIIATDRSHNKVLDIQKLAAEMDLSCIKTFKLDALKSVCRRDDIETFTDPCSCNAKNDVTNQVFDSPNLQVERVSPLVTEGLKSQTLEESYMPLFATC
ncbi:putative methyltransferase NSUN6 [Spatholobus suberectus]|nr:putative methyltransferase NSUN6 [Spatholobus suberectus]